MLILVPYLIIFLFTAEWLDFPNFWFILSFEIDLVILKFIFISIIISCWCSQLINWGKLSFFYSYLQLFRCSPSYVLLIIDINHQSVKFETLFLAIKKSLLCTFLLLRTCFQFGKCFNLAKLFNDIKIDCLDL